MITSNRLLTSKQQEVHLVIYREFFDLWSGYDHVWISTELLSLSLDIAKGPGY